MYKCKPGLGASDEIDIGTDLWMVPALDESERIQPTNTYPGYSNLGPNKPTVEQDAGLQRNLAKAWAIGQGQMVYTGSKYYQPTGPGSGSGTLAIAAAAVAAFLFLRRKKNPRRRRSRR